MNVKQNYLIKSTEQNVSTLQNVLLINEKQWNK